MALELQEHGKFESNKMTEIKLEPNVTNKRVLFKQITWIPNEIPKSNLILFTMLDRVMCPSCKCYQQDDIIKRLNLNLKFLKAWLKRIREIVKSDGALIVYSALWNTQNLMEELGNE